MDGVQTITGGFTVYASGKGTVEVFRHRNRWRVRWTGDVAVIAKGGKPAPRAKRSREKGYLPGHRESA